MPVACRSSYPPPCRRSHRPRRPPSRAPGPLGTTRLGRLSRCAPGDTVFDLARRAPHVDGRPGGGEPVGRRRSDDPSRPAPPGARHSPTAPRAPRPAYVTHVVGGGETISELAAHYRISPVGAAVGEPSGPPRGGSTSASTCGCPRRRPTRPPRNAPRPPGWCSLPGPDRRQRQPAGRCGSTPARPRSARPTGSARGSLIRAGATAADPRPPAQHHRCCHQLRRPQLPDRHAARGRAQPQHAGPPPVPCRPERATRDLIVRTARRYGVDPGLALAVGLAGVRLEPATGVRRQRHRHHAGRPGHRASGPPPWPAAGWTCSRPADNVTAGRPGAARPPPAARTTAAGGGRLLPGAGSVRATGCTPTPALCGACRAAGPFG